MWLSSWLPLFRFAAHRRPGRPARPVPRFRPQLEGLEARSLPSVTPLAVTNTLDGGRGSLRYEIAQAEKGNGKGTIVFNIPKTDPGYNASTRAWTITLTSGELDITGGLTIQGPGAGQLTVSGGNHSRVFEVNARDPVFISGLTISGGTAFYSNSALPYDFDGGGILNLSTLTLSDCIVSGNSADAPAPVYGGGIYNAGTLTLSGCTVSGNYAIADLAPAYGGGIYNAGTLTITNSTLFGNDTNGSGGAVLNAGTLVVSTSKFYSNFPDNIDGSYTDGGGNTFS
jgi:hypothetical protein